MTLSRALIEKSKPNLSTATIQSNTISTSPSHDLKYKSQPLYGFHLKPGCFQSRAWICSWSNPASFESTSIFSLLLLSHFIQNKSVILNSRIRLDVARLRPLPMGKLGPSPGKKDQVEIRPPMFPNMTFVPMADERAVSETTFAET